MGKPKIVPYYGEKFVTERPHSGQAVREPGPMPSFEDDLGRLTPHLRRLARALVRGHSTQAADDLVQETIVLAMRAERLAKDLDLQSWCVATLLRVHRLREKTATARLGSDTGPAGGKPVAGPLPFLPRDIARLDQLSLDCREVLLLTALAGFSYTRIAEILHVTVETVMLRLDLARHALMKQGHAAGGVGERGGRPTPRRSAQFLRVVE